VTLSEGWESGAHRGARTGGQRGAQRRKQGERGAWLLLLRGEVPPYYSGARCPPTTQGRGAPLLLRGEVPPYYSKKQHVSRDT
jgi:hypothetical protein